jgi:hypothetical protein
MLMPPQLPHQDEGQWDVRRGRGWAMMQRHLLSLLAVVATDQSKLPKNNDGQLPCKVVGRNGPDQSNNNDMHCRMGGGMTWTLDGVAIITENMRIGVDGTWTTIKSNRDVT